MALEAMNISFVPGWAANDWKQAHSNARPRNRSLDACDVTVRRTFMRLSSVAVTGGSIHAGEWVTPWEGTERGKGQFQFCFFLDLDSVPT